MTEPVHEPVREVRQRPTRPVRKPPARRRRRKRSASRPYVIAGVVVLVVVAAFVARSVVNGRRNASFQSITAAAGCGKVQKVPNLDRTHETGVAIKYSTSPPAGGAHDPSPLGPGVYNTPFSTNPAQHPSIYQAVHSLEHGYVIVWYNPDLSKSDVDALTGAVGGESKVILVPYPDLQSKDKMAMSAWGHVQYCGKAQAKAVEAFTKHYRGTAGSAPEPLNP